MPSSCSRSSPHPCKPLHYTSSVPQVSRPYNPDSEDQYKCGCDLVIGDTAIDDTGLGAPCNDSEEVPNTTWMEVGCAWSGENWSCAYDAVFMSFWSIYRGSSPSWQRKWRQQSPIWGNLLGAAFDLLLTTTQCRQISQAALSQEFTTFRDEFRDKLSQVNPEYFRCHGAVLASVCQVLGRVFGGSIGCEPYLAQLVACDQCNISVYNHCPLTLLGSTQLLSEYLNEDEVGTPLPLQMAVTRYVQHLSQDPHRNCCFTCSGPPRVESLSIPGMPLSHMRNPSPLI